MSALRRGDARPGRGGRPAADGEARVRGLVVSGVLPGQRGPVHGVVQQCGDPGAGLVRRGVDPQGRVVAGRPHDLLVPVAEQVAGDRRGGLGAVVGVDRGPGQQSGVGRRAVLVDVGAVEEFTGGVAVPPGQEVGAGRLAAGDHVSLGAAYTGDRRGPGLGTGAAGPDVAGDPASVVPARRRRPEDLPGLRVRHPRGRLRAVLVDLELLQARPGRIEVTDVHGVAVAVLRGPQSAAVVVHGHGAVDDLVLAVPIGVGDGELVVALAVVALAGVRRTVRVEGPAPGEGAAPPVPRGDDAPRVVAARHDQGGPGAVQIGRAGEEAVDPVAVGVAPRGHRAACGDVVDGAHRRTGPSVEYRQELGPRQDVSGGVAVVGGGTADDLPGTVHAAVGGLHGDLGLAVAVVVVHLELGVVRAGPDVPAQIDPPQAGAVQLVRVDVHVAGVAGLRVVLAVGRVPLEDDLVGAVAVQVADGGVVGGVRVRDAVGGGAAGRDLDGDVHRARGQRGGGRDGGERAR